MSMNIFRFSGDMLHVAAILMVLHRLFVKKNAQGLSLKTQYLLLMVSLTRYVDVMTTFYSVYNSMMKVFYITSSVSICAAMTRLSPINTTYRAEQDSFPVLKLAVAPCAVIAIVTHLTYAGMNDIPDFLEYLWTFSIYMEAVALLPQVAMYRKYRQVESLTGTVFLLMMGAYRGLYILNWIYRANTERHYKHHWVVYGCGVCQVATVIFGVFCFCCTSEEETQVAAPLWPQLCDFCRTTCVVWVIFPFVVVGVLLAKVFDGTSGFVTMVLLGGITMIPCIGYAYVAMSNRSAASEDSGEDGLDVSKDLEAPLFPSTEESEREMEQSNTAQGEGESSPIEASASDEPQNEEPNKPDEI